MSRECMMALSLGEKNLTAKAKILISAFLMCSAVAGQIGI